MVKEKYFRIPFLKPCPPKSQLLSVVCFGLDFFFDAEMASSHELSTIPISFCASFASHIIII